MPHSELCNAFTKPTLPYTMDRNASCPFSGPVCRAEFGNLLIDSGELSSSTHLGLNDGPKFTVRRSTHCAPLATTNFTEVQTTPDSTKSSTIYKYGSYVDGGYAFEFENNKTRNDFDELIPGDYKIT